MWKLLVVLCVVTVNCVIYDGPCPVVDSGFFKNFSCADHFMKNSRFKVLAHLPTSNESINLFQNPLGNLDDLEVEFLCSIMGGVVTYKETVNFFMTCNAKITQNDSIRFGCNYKTINSSTKAWDPIIYDDCKPGSFWSSVNIVSYVKQLYAVLWGCRSLGNDKHEQGAWVLGNKDNFTESVKILDRLLNTDLKFANVSTKDYILYNQTFLGRKSPCSMKTCESNLLCKNDVEYSEEDL